jgi:hypothetical protein
MAAENAASAQAQAPDQTMRTDRLLGIMRAGGGVPAAALQSEHELQRRKNDAISPDKKDGNRLHERFSMAKFPKKATRYRRNPQHRAANS